MVEPAKSRGNQLLEGFVIGLDLQEAQSTRILSGSQIVAMVDGGQHMTHQLSSSLKRKTPMAISLILEKRIPRTEYQGSRPLRRRYPVGVVCVKATDELQITAGQLGVMFKLDEFQFGHRPAQINLLPNTSNVESRVAMTNTSAQGRSLA